MRFEDLQATFCATLVDEWVRAGVRHAVVCPGSRSTPLAIVLADAADAGHLELSVVLDERSAGFACLGIAMASGRPAVLLTTSGTAAAELHPAVAEADLARVPMIICTADRPPELHGVGAAQTLDQQHLFGRSVRWFCDPGVADTANSGAWRSVASRAIAEAIHGPLGPGPVHLNLPFREPLVGTPQPLPGGRFDGGSWHECIAPTVIDEHVAGDLLRQWANRNGVFVVGHGAPSAEDVYALADVLDWPVLADPRSGCRVPRARTCIGAADAFLRDAETADRLRPDVVVHIGAPWASKVMGGWLAATGAVHVVVDPSWAWQDADRVASLVVRSDAGGLCRSLVRAAAGTNATRPADPGWARAWRDTEAVALSVFSRLLDGPDTPCSEPAIARVVLDAVLDGGALVLSSSMPVRDVEWYGAPRADVRVLSNRGVNGIDGVVSTVVGVAVSGAASAVVGLLGDLALLHDIGGLVTARQLGVNATFVVVDNGGGGIFEFLPQARLLDRNRFERLFGTPQDVALPSVIGGIGMRVSVVDSLGALSKAMIAEQSENGPGAVIVRVDRHANVALHDALHADVAEALRGQRADATPAKP